MANNAIYATFQELGGGVHFKQGQELVLTSDQQVRDRCDRSCLYVNSQYFLEKASVGQVVLLGDGLLSLIIKDKRELCRSLSLTGHTSVVSWLSCSYRDMSLVFNSARDQFNSKVV